MIGQCSKKKGQVDKGLKKFLHDLKKHDLDYAINNIENEKVSYFIDNIIHDPTFHVTLVNTEKRVQNFYNAFRYDFENKMETISSNVKCIKDTEIRKIETAHILFKKIEAICNDSPSGVDIDDVNVIFEAHCIGLDYENLLFVTKDNKDIIIHKEELLKITSIKDIIPLFEPN